MSGKSVAYVPQPRPLRTNQLGFVLATFIGRLMRLTWETMKDTNTEAEWMNTRAVAERLGIPVRQVYDLVDRHVLDGFSVDGALKMRAADVARYHGEHPRPPQA
jgi:hypothetical protein